MSATLDEPAYRLLITGATGGMGRSCAELAAEAGYHLILADLALDKLQELAAECEARGVGADIVQLDITQVDSVARFLAVIDDSAGLDALIHTVGVSPQMANWEQIIDVDLTKSVGLLEQLRPQLKAGGCAVCISSMSGYLCPENEDIERGMAALWPDDSQTGMRELVTSFPILENAGMAYAYAKKAIRHYVAARAAAWGSENKRLVSISPGLINTPMGQLEMKAMDNYEAMRSRIALDRLGEPRDIAETALFLISERAAYISGCDILVDGGFVASSATASARGQ